VSKTKGTAREKKPEKAPRPEKASGAVRHHHRKRQSPSGILYRGVVLEGFKEIRPDPNPPSPFECARQMLDDAKRRRYGYAPNHHVQYSTPARAA